MTDKHSTAIINLSQDQILKIGRYKAAIEKIYSSLEKAKKDGMFDNPIVKVTWFGLNRAILYKECEKAARTIMLELEKASGTDIDFQDYVRFFKWKGSVDVLYKKSYREELVELYNMANLYEFSQKEESITLNLTGDLSYRLTKILNSNV